MARPTTRIDRQFLIDQKDKRENLRNLPGSSGNSIPELRSRLTVVEEILSLRQHNS